MNIEERSAEIAKLCAGLVAAQKAVDPVAKASKNTHFGYKYASGEDMIAEGRDALTAGDLALLPVDQRVVVCATTEHPDIPDKVCVTYQLVHASGEWMRIYSETPIIPEKGRPEDKALAAAKTYDLAYLLRTLLLIPRVSEDVDQRDDRNYQPRRQQQDDRRPAPQQRRDEQPRAAQPPSGTPPASAPQQSTAPKQPAAPTTSATAAPPPAAAPAEPQRTGFWAAVEEMGLRKREVEDLAGEMFTERDVRRLSQEQRGKLMETLRALAATANGGAVAVLNEARAAQANGR